MKTLEQVKNYLEVEGMNSTDIHKVIGFLYAEGDFVLGTCLKHKVTKNTFQNFVNWYEEEEDDPFDKLFAMRQEVESLWANIRKNFPTIDFNDDSFDLREHQKAVRFCKTTAEMIEEVLDKMNKTLNEMEDGFLESSEEKEVK